MHYRTPQTFESSGSSKKVSKKNLSFFVVSIVILILLSSFIFSFGVRIRNTEKRITQDLIYYLNYLVFSKSELIAMNSVLKKDREDLLERVTLLESAFKRGDSKQEELTKSINVRTVSGNIISSLDRDIYEIFSIEYEPNENIKKGSLVIDKDNMIIGIIEKKGETKSLVTLISFPDNEVNGRIDNSNDAIVLIGRGNGQYRAKIGRDVPILLGDTVSFLEHPEYKLGIVGDISFDERDPYKTVLIRIPNSLSSIKNIRITLQ